MGFWINVENGAKKGHKSKFPCISWVRAEEVAMVTMISGAENVVLPSKTYSAMAAGQAILAIAPEALHGKRCRALSATRQYYDVKVVAKQWADLFENL